MPALAAEAFDFRTSNAQQVIADSLSRVIHRINSNFFMGKVEHNAMIPYCSKQFYDLQSLRMDLEVALDINKLLINDVNHSDVLIHALNENYLDEPRFKSVMRLYESRSRNDIFIVDVIYVASVALGVDTDIAKLRQAITSLPQGDSREFDVGITVSFAKNGNLTIKMDKAVVEKLNSMLPK